MYKHNPIPTKLTDKQLKEIFNIKNLKSLVNNLNEKKENEEMTETDLLLDTVIQKQSNILNKAQLIDEKAEKYKIAEKGEVIQNLLTALEKVEAELDDSLESFEKTEDAISKALNSIKEKTLEAWSEIEEAYEEEQEYKVEEKVYVELDIRKSDQYINQFYSDDYLVTYSIKESNGIKRGGRKLINSASYNTQGTLPEFIVDLIKQYEEELGNGDVISYEGFITV